MLAASDCELITQGFWGQPANAVSALAFVLVGIVIVRSRPALAVGAVAVGVGSFLFHGPMPHWAQWAHDWSLGLLILVLVWEDRPARLAAGTAAFAALFALWPDTAALVTGGLLVITVGVLGLRSRGREPAPTAAAATLGIGVMINLASRTGGFLCSPDSILQGHAAWHVLAALAIALWSFTSEPGARQGN